MPPFPNPQDPYDPNQPTPQVAPGGTWSSMAPAIVPAIIGALMGGGQGALVGGIGGAEGIQAEREKAIQYNNQLLFRKREDERQAREMSLLEQRAVREQQSHELAVKNAQLAYDQATKTAEGREKIRQQITDPYQQSLFQAYPEAYGPYMMEDLKRKDLAKRWEGMIPLVGKLAPGVDPKMVIEAFGEKIPEFIHQQQALALEEKYKMGTLKETEWWHREQLKIEAGRLAAEQRPRLQFSENGEVFAEIGPKGDIKWGRVADKLGPYVNTKEYQTALKSLEDIYKKDPLMQRDPTGRQLSLPEFIALPENQAYLGVKSGAIPPDQYGSVMANRIKDLQDLELKAEKQAREKWTQSFWKKSGATDEEWTKYKATNTGRQLLESARQKIQLQKRNYTASVNPTREDVAPPTTPGGKQPTLDEIFR